ncbi:MAG: hypothetical protein M1827_005771 [Pycnora praestabilis]|nr:MAG: hypothetical protein M1827_005771 [Pycnora praestabilis]
MTSPLPTVTQLQQPTIIPPSSKIHRPSLRSLSGKGRVVDAGSAGERQLVTTILVNNIHCASCVSHVREVLDALHPALLDVEINILSHEVRAYHTDALSIREFCRPLNDAAFELYSALTVDSNGEKVAEQDFKYGTDGWLEQAAEYLQSPSRQGTASSRSSRSGKHLGNYKRKRHIENCQACQEEDMMVNEKRTVQTEISKETTVWSPSRWRFRSRARRISALNEKHMLSTLASNDSRSLPKDSSNMGSISMSELSPHKSETEGKRVRQVSCIESHLDHAIPISKESPSETTSLKPGEEHRAVLSIGGMTCASCTSAITEGVKEFQWVKSVDVTLLTNSATLVFSGPKTNTGILVDKIEELGYECSVQECFPSKSAQLRKDIRHPPTLQTQDLKTLIATLSIGGMTCASCTSAITNGVQELPWIQSVNVTLLTNSASVTFEGTEERIHEVVEKIEDLGYECSIDNVSPILDLKQAAGNSRRKPVFSDYKATLSIGGMTCASCTGAISHGLQELSFVSSIDVGLMTNSASVFFEGKDHLEKIVEKVEDLGYDCHIEDCIPVDDLHYDHTDEEILSRTLMIQIHGMFCEHCPTKVCEGLESMFKDNIIIEKPPSLKDPIMRVTYTPQPPRFTVRHIISTIKSLDKSFATNIYHPPSIEERSRIMQLHEQHRLFLRLLLSVIFAIPTFLVGVVWMSLVHSSHSIRKFFERPVWAGSASRAVWALFIIATPVMFFAADVFHVRAIKEIKALWRRSSKVPMMRRFYRFGSMNLLISAGTSVAYFASLALLIVEATTKQSQLGMSTGQTTTYFDSVVFLTMFILLGRFLEAYSKAKTGDAVTLLRDLRPSEALLVPTASKEATGSSMSRTSSGEGAQGHTIKKIHVDLLEAGDCVLVPHGSSPPGDGIITIGETRFNESSLTGESRPITKFAGDTVFAGAVNVGKPITVKVTEVNGTSMLDQIVSVVREGQTKRAPVERVADILTGYFVPVITAIALATFFTWFALGQSGFLPEDYLNIESGGWAFWSLEFAIAVFVVACPCGIGLAAPTALFVGSGLAAKHGILVKGGGEAFQEASNLDVVVFDKTGTLTTGGGLKVTDHDVLSSGMDESTIWALVQALEESSSHPIAKAIISLCETKSRASIQHADIDEIAGRGLRGTFTISRTDEQSQFEAAIGNEDLIRSLGLQLDGYWISNTQKWKTEGKSVALLCIRLLPKEGASSEFSLAAQFATTDPLRPEAVKVVRKLQAFGLMTYMLTGDNATTAVAIGEQVGIPASNVIAGVLPSEKADKIRWLQGNAPKRNLSGSTLSKDKKHKAIVAMLGDGINDSPALTMANVSIAIGSGSDIAISSSSFILLTSNLTSLLTLIDLSRTVFRRVKFNFAWALVYNLAMLPVAAGVFYALHEHPRLNPVWASLAMAMSSISVIGSSLLLRTRLPWVGFRASETTMGIHD